MATEKISDQFQGLPMESLIGGPLTAACNAQVQLANSTATFINTVGFEPGADDAGFSRLRNVRFAFDRPTEIAGGVGGDGAEIVPGTEEVSLTIPLLAITPVPNLQVDEVDVTFDMEVKSSEQHKDSEDKELELDASLTGGIGPFNLSVKVHGKVSSHQENTRSSDQSAKYHVGVKATNHGMPEGLARVFDLMASSIAPVTHARPDAAFPRAIEGTATAAGSRPAGGLPAGGQSTGGQSTGGQPAGGPTAGDEPA